MADLTLEEIKNALKDTYGVDDIADKRNPLSTYTPGTEIAPRELSIKDVSNAIQQAFSPDTEPVKPSGILPSWLKTGVETGLGVASGMATPVVGGLYGLAKSIPEAIQTGQAPQPIAQKYAEQFIRQHPGYKVTDPQAQANLEAVQRAFEASKLPPVMPEGLQMSKGGATPKEIIMATKANLPKISIQKSGAEAQLANQFGQRIEPQMNVTQTPQSVGAASTSHQSAVKAQIDAMPDTSLAKQNILQEMQPKTNPDGTTSPGKSAADINLDALQTQSKFEKFGMNATKGEALNDTQLISDEYNNRAKPENKPLLDRFNERNTQLANAFDNLRDKYAENATGGTPVALANDVLETLNNKAKGYEKNISDLYKKAYKAAGEGNNPIDVAGLNENINNALNFEHRTEYLPEQLAKQLKEKLAKGYLTPQEFENFRTDSGEIARTDPDGKVRRAASIVREQFENAPIKGDFAYVKPMFDEARNAVSEWKTKQENMPFYDTAMSDTRTPEDIAKGLPHPGSTAFFDKYVNNKNIPDLSLSRLVGEVGENTPAHEALKAGSLLKLKENSVNSQGVVSQSKIYDGINKTFAGDKSRILHGSELAQDLQDLAFVATRSEHLKGGATYSNASQTQVANAREQALQAAQSAAGKIAEGAVNLKTGGIGGTAIRGALNYFNKAQIEQAAKEAHQKQLNDALKPHAGVFKD
jgi:hypothetical protein